MIQGRIVGRCCVHGCAVATLPHWFVCFEHALRMMLVDVPSRWWQFGHVMPFRPEANGKAASLIFVPSSVRAEALTAAWALIGADRTGSAQALATLRESLAACVRTIEHPERQEAFARALSGRPEQDRAEDDGAGAWPAWSGLEAWAANVLFGRGWLLYPPNEDEAHQVGDEGLRERIKMLEGNLTTIEAAHVEAMKERDEARANFKHAYDVAIRWEEEARRCWSVIQEGAGPMGKIDDFAAEMERRAEEIREKSAGLLLGAAGLLEDVYAAVDAAIPLEKDPFAKRSLMAMKKRLARVRDEKLDCGGWGPDADGPRCKGCELSEWACRENIRENAAKCCDECSHDVSLGDYPTKDGTFGVAGHSATCICHRCDPLGVAMARETGLVAACDDPGLMADPPVEIGPAADENVDPGSDICGYCGAARVDHLGVVQRCPEVNQAGYSLVFDVDPPEMAEGKPDFRLGEAAPGDAAADVCLRCAFVREDHDHEATSDEMFCPRVNEIVDAAADVGPLYPGQTMSMFEGVDGRPELCAVCSYNVEAHAGGLCPVQRRHGRTVPAPAPVEAEVASGGAEAEDLRGSETLYTETLSLPFQPSTEKSLDPAQEKTEEKSLCEASAKGVVGRHEIIAAGLRGVGNDQVIGFLVQWVKKYPWADSAELRTVYETYAKKRQGVSLADKVSIANTLWQVVDASMRDRLSMLMAVERDEAVLELRVTWKPNGAICFIGDDGWLKNARYQLAEAAARVVAKGCAGQDWAFDHEKKHVWAWAIACVLAEKFPYVRLNDPWCDVANGDPRAEMYREERDRLAKVLVEMLEGRGV